MSDGERVERLIFDWLERNYPDGPTWYDRAKDGFTPALEIRMISAFGAVEYNISNGGWAQFLWNCFPHWREIIADAKEGYLSDRARRSRVLHSIAFTPYVSATKGMRRDDREIDKGKRLDHLFRRFTSRSDPAPASGWEDLFWDKAMYEKRSAWLAANEARVRAAMGLN